MWAEKWDPIYLAWHILQPAGELSYTMIITIVVSHGRIKESSKARAGLDGALVDTFS